MKQKKSKKGIIIAIIALLIAGGVCAYFFLFNKGNSDEVVYVTPVRNIASGDVGSINRFSGVVEARQTVDYNLDSNKKLKEIYVSVGDEVKKGDKLFCYNTDDIKLEIEQIRIDIQRLNASIESNNEQITELEKQKNAAADTETQLEISLMIQQLQNENRSNSYSIKAKNNELNQKSESLNNTDVLSDVDGTVKAINQDSYNNQPFMQVMESGEYTVKGTVNEYNVYEIPEGTTVTIYSRIEDKSWMGYVSKIDLNGNASSGDDYYYGNQAESTKYNFYVTLDESDGLFLGQHVIIKPENGTAKTGLWIPEYYIVDANTDPYVYKDNKGKIAKQKLTLGKFDENTFEYEVISGLDKSDSIAFPEEGIKEGSKTASEAQYSYGADAGYGDKQ